MSATKASIFRVEWSEPYRPEGRPPYNVNKQANVVCDSVEQAIALVRDESAEAVIHAVHRLGTNALTIVAPRVGIRGSGDHA